MSTYSTHLTTSSSTIDTPDDLQFTARTYKGITPFDAIMEFAIEDTFSVWEEFNQSDSVIGSYFFYKNREYEDSGLTIDERDDPVIDTQFPDDGFDVINSVTVYGDMIDGTQVVGKAEDKASQKHYNIIKEELVVDKKLKSSSERIRRAKGILEDKAYSIRRGVVKTSGDSS